MKVAFTCRACEQRVSTEWQPGSAELDCPACGTAAPRALLTAPRLAVMDGNRRHAFETNERSRHAPTHSTAEGRANGHGAGCSCCSGPKKKASVAANGAKAFPSKRPWMISH